MDKSICTVKECRNYERYCRIPGHAKNVAAPTVTKPKRHIPRKPMTKEEIDQSKKRSEFYNLMIMQRPEYCQESGKPLEQSMFINPRSIVAHILPKREQGGVPSMQYDQRNIIYLDQDVHTNMDNKGKDFVMKMKIYGLMKRRVKSMWKDIPEHEKKNVPEYLRP